MEGAFPYTDGETSYPMRCIKAVVTSVGLCTSNDLSPPWSWLDGGHPAVASREDSAAWVLWHTRIRIKQNRSLVPGAFGGESPCQSCHILLPYIPSILFQLSGFNNRHFGWIRRPKIVPSQTFTLHKHRVPPKLTPWQGFTLSLCQNWEGPIAPGSKACMGASLTRLFWV